MHDGVGSVERLEVFGNDLTVVNAARVSFAKESYEITKGDEGLIRYLARNNHISPFFHPQIRFRIKMPIFVAREWYRHTIGLSRNEVSRRYVDSKPECWIPVTGLRERDPKLKQGSKATVHPQSNTLIGEWSYMQKQIMDFYDKLLADGVAPEVARGILPQSMYTEFIETGSLYAYARLCLLRLDPHAQKEIRDYAEAISNCLESQFPVSWKALMHAAEEAEAAKIKKAVDDALAAAAVAAEEAVVAAAAKAKAEQDAARELAIKMANPDMSHLNHWGC
jgi:thymidylate synthase (FAD)